MVVVRVVVVRVVAESAAVGRTVGLAVSVVQEFVGYAKEGAVALRAGASKVGSATALGERAAMRRASVQVSKGVPRAVAAVSEAVVPAQSVEQGSRASMPV